MPENLWFSYVLRGYRNVISVSLNTLPSSICEFKGGSQVERMCKFYGMQRVPLKDIKLGFPLSIFWYHWQYPQRLTTSLDCPIWLCERGFFL